MNKSHFYTTDVDLDEEEKQKILIEWNSTQKDYPQGKTIHQLFEEQAEKNPEKVAVIFEDTSLTYRKLNEKANQLAHFLKEKGIKPDTLIAIACDRSFDLIIGILAILKAGGAYVPLDPTYPLERLSYMIEDTQAPFILTQSFLKDHLPKTNANLILLDDTALFNDYSSSNLDPTSQSLAYVIYTSGSTGKPKGVMTEHESICNRLFWWQDYAPLGSKDRYLHQCSFSFDGAVVSLWWPLLNGSTVVLPTSQGLSDGSYLINLIKRHKINTFLSTPSLMDILLDQMQEIDYIRKLMFAGEAFSKPILKKAQKIKGCQIYNFYGPTESTIITTSYKVPAEPLTSSTVPIGTPVANTHVYILDASLQPVPIGVVGELYIGGEGLARGYLNQPDLTAERFIPHPFVTGKKIYKTGDLCRWLEDGHIEYIGRIDDQVKLRGFRIELGEIESILGQHPQISNAVVLLREDIPSDQRLVAYILFQNNPVDTEVLRTFLKDKLPDYMIPSAFVTMDRFPLTPNGKIDKKALPKPLYQLTAEYVQPQTPNEKKLAQIWQKILKVKRVGIHDNFFQLGGYSLLAIRLMTEISKSFNTYIPVHLLFEYPTLKEFSLKIEEFLLKGLDNIDFAEEAKLENSIQLSVPFSSYPKALNNIFLTGASGYIGAFLLNELLKSPYTNTIYCLVRSKNPEEAQWKLQKTLKEYLLWDSNKLKKVVPITGDLEKPNLGLGKADYEWLKQHIDIVYHCASDVNFIKPYSELKKSTVFGTKEILTFCTKHKTKPLHYISTLAVFSFDHKVREDGFIYEDDSLSDSLESLPKNIGYAQSKWVTEQIVWEAINRGIPAAIYRPGFVVCHSESGVANKSGFWAKLIKDCIALKCFPNFSDLKQEFITVDYTAQAIAYISQQENCLGKAFHLSPQPEHNVSFTQLFELVKENGFSLNKIPFSEWCQKFIDYTSQEKSTATVFLPLFTQKIQEEKTLLELYQNGPHVSIRNTEALLANSSVKCHAIDKKIMSKYLNYLKSIHFLP